MDSNMGGGGDLGSASGSIELDASGALSALKSVTAGLQNLSSQSQSHGKGLLSFASAHEQSLNTIGTGLLGVGASFLGAFGLATKTAMDFDAQISAVGSVAGASQEQLAALREEALRLGAETSFSASEAAAGMEIMLKAGASLESVLNGGTEAVMNLSAATGVDVPLAAETAATAMNTFGVSAEEAADIITQSANASSLDVNDWALALKSAGPVASALGLDMQDLASWMVILGDAGIKGEVGATAMRNILLNMSDPAGEAALALADYGVATHDASGNMRDMALITEDLAGTWGTLTQAEKVALAQTVAGKDGAAAFMVTMDAQTEALENNTNAFKESEKRMAATGTASEQAQARMDNLKGSFEEMMGAAETTVIELVSGLTPALRKVVDGLTGLIRNVLKLPPNVRTAIAAFTGIAGVLATVSGGFLLMLPRIASTVAAFRDLGGMAGVIRPLTMAIGALTSPIGLVIIAAGLLAYVFRDEIGAAISAVVGWFRDFVAGSEQVRAMVNNLVSAFEAFKSGNFGEAFAAVGRAAGNLWAAIQEAVAMIDWGSVGQTLLDGLIGLASFIAGFVLDLGSIAVSVGDWLWNQAVDLWTDLKSWAVGLVPEGEPVNVGTVLASIADWAFSAAKDLWDALMGWAVGGTYGDGTGGATAGKVGQVPLGTVLANIADWAFSSARDLFADVTAWAQGHFQQAVQITVDFIVNPDNLSMGGIKDFEDAVQGIKNDWNTIRSAIEWIRDSDLSMGGIKDFQDAVSGLQNDWSRIRGAALWVQDTFTLGTGIRDFQDAVQGIKNDWNTVRSAIEGINSIADFPGISSVSELVKGIKNDIETVQRIWNALFGGGDDKGSANSGKADDTEYVNKGGSGTGGVGGSGGGSYGGGGGWELPSLSGMPVIFDNIAAAAGRAAAAVLPVNTNVAAIAGQSAAVTAFGGAATSAFLTSGSAAQTGLSPISPLVAAMAAGLTGAAIPAFVGIQASAATNFASMLSAVSSNTASASSTAGTNASSMNAKVAGEMAGMQVKSAAQMVLLAASAASNFSTMQTAATTAGSRLASEMTNGATRALNGVRSALSQIPGVVSGIGGSAAATARNVGAMIGTGMAQGMESMLGRIRAAANAMVAAAETALAARARLGSPSKLFRELGAFVGEGFELGIRSMIPDVARAAAALVSVPGIGGNTYGYGSAYTPAYAYAPTSGVVVNNYHHHHTEYIALSTSDLQRLTAQAERGANHAAAWGQVDSLTQYLGGS